MTDTLRGHPIEQLNGTWVFADTKEPTITTWKQRPCGHCGLHNTKEGHDGCLGTLNGVMNACCGHGDVDDAYIQFSNGFIIRGIYAKRYMAEVKRVKRND